jgi:hypothetical protein
MADEQPEHEWYRVRETEPGIWLCRDRIAGIEGYTSTEVAMTLPLWPEEGNPA